MKRLLITSSLFVICNLCHGQNLIPNGSFEQYWGCPTWGSQLDSCLFWSNPSSGGGTPDYYNQCSTSWTADVPNNPLGFQFAHSGSAYVGIFLWITGNSPRREYIECPFDITLDSNVCYHFEMFVNLSNRSKYTTDDFGVYFSDTLVDSIPNLLPLPFTPQFSNAVGNVPDSANWMSVSFDYFANGTENFLIIGNFKTDSLTSMNIVNSSGTDHAYIYIDDVSLIRCETEIEEPNTTAVVTVFPNPFANILNIATDLIDPVEFVLYDVTGRKVLGQSFVSSTSINTEQFNEGIYFYVLSTTNGVIKTGKIVKD